MAIKRKEIICSCCGKNKVATGNNFFKDDNPIYKSTGYFPLCKDCAYKMYDELVLNGKSDYEAAIEMCKKFDRPFIYDLYVSTVGKSKEDSRILGIYFKNIAMLQYKNAGIVRFEHSVFEPELKKDISIFKQKDNFLATNVNLEELKEKYGYGYPDEEYSLFEKKYQELRPSFQLLTTMHDECLREYCVDKVKETLAKAKGDFKEAKEWASMAKDAATSGKLNPSQMSKADLSSGMDTFGQMVRMVEEEVDIIPLLPKFTDKPKDKVDIVLWHYVNYVRDLKGLPLCEYKEIYDFYERRKEDYEKQMSDNEMIEGEE